MNSNVGHSQQRHGLAMRWLAVSGAALLAALSALVSIPAFAEEPPEPLMFRADGSNVPSVQRGARDFMNYCSGCHSMKYLRYGRMGQDLGISDDILRKNLMFTTDKVGEPIVSAMPASAKDWFGQLPPDLTLETKARGSDWVYSYLMSFYLDSKRPMGVNNLYLPGVSMPHVLGALQGWQIKETPKAEGNSEGEGESASLKLAQPGTLTPPEYNEFVTDLVNFMTYAAEPSATDRVQTGIKVMVYLLVLLALTYLLKKEYWRDIH